MVMWAKCAQVAKVMYKDDFSKIYCENNNTTIFEIKTKRPNNLLKLLGHLCNI